MSKNAGYLTSSDYFNYLDNSSVCSSMNYTTKEFRICDNKECTENYQELHKADDDLINLQQKLMTLENNMLEKQKDLRDKIKSSFNRISKLKEELAFYRGETVSSLNYYELTNLEKHQLNMLKKIKKKLTECELKVMKDDISIEISNMCHMCNNSKINTIIKPCFHAHYCQDCVEYIIFCDMCNGKVESWEKVYIDYSNNVK